MLLRIIILLSFLSCLTAKAQQRHDWEDYFYDDAYGLEEYDEAQMEEEYERLCELELSPMNINTATVEELSDIPGLTLDQIDEIIRHRDRYGGFTILEELSMIPSISARQRLFICHFLVAQPVEKGEWYSKENLKKILAGGRGEVTTNLGIPLYSRKGDREGYLGDKYKYSTKLTGKFSEHIKYGLIGAKDAGEPFLSNGNGKGFDFYSFFVNVNGLGRIKSLVLGRYRVRMGLGLVQNGNFSFGKQMMLSSVSRPATRITGHSTRSDANYLQGAAAVVDLGKKGGDGKVTLSAFYSYRHIDATLGDSGAVKTIVTSGYHRTEGEMNRKHNTAEACGGIGIAYDRGCWHVGVNGVYDWYNRTLKPDDGAIFRRYFPRGNAFWNVSADYGYVTPTFSLYGETATGDCGALATLNIMKIKLHDDLAVTGVQRFYSYKYYALHANAFSDGGEVNNENGMYVGLLWRAGRHFSLNAYTDISYHPWMKYLTGNSSYAWDNSLSGTFERKSRTYTIRYRMRLKQRDNAAKSALYDRYEHRLRLVMESSGNVVSLRSQADMSYVALETSGSFGWMLSQMCTISLPKDVELSAMMAYFNTKDYDSRLYTYERKMPGAFSMPSFYGKGVRFSALCKAKLSDSFFLTARLGFSKYFDRDVISSSLRQIDASYQTDIDLMARWKF